MSDTEKATDEQMKRVYARGYDKAFAAHPLGDRGVWIAGGVRAVAEWARGAGRAAALEEAEKVASGTLTVPNLIHPQGIDYAADSRSLLIVQRIANLRRSTGTEGDTE